MMRCTANLLSVGDTAPDVELTRCNGSVVALRQLHEAAPIALLFLRHLG